MHHKNIKVIIRKQLKKQYPNWSRLPQKIKQYIIQEVIAEYVSEYAISRPVTE